MTSMRMAGLNRKMDFLWSRSLHQLGRAALLVAAITYLAVLRTMAWAAVPQGVWLMNSRVAVQIFDCDSLLCGRILWLLVPRILRVNWTWTRIIRSGAAAAQTLRPDCNLGPAPH